MTFDEFQKEFQHIKDIHESVMSDDAWSTTLKANLHLLSSEALEFISNGYHKGTDSHGNGCNWSKDVVDKAEQLIAERIERILLHND